MKVVHARIGLFALAIALIAACGGESVVGTPPAATSGDTTAKVVSLKLTIEKLSLVAGQHEYVWASALDARGNPISPGPHVTWSFSAPGIITADSSHGFCANGFYICEIQTVDAGAVTLTARVAGGDVAASTSLGVTMLGPGDSLARNNPPIDLNLPGGTSSYGDTLIVNLTAGDTLDFGLFLGSGRTISSLDAPLAMTKAVDRSLGLAPDAVVYPRVVVSQSAHYRLALGGLFPRTPVIVRIRRSAPIVAVSAQAGAFRHTATVGDRFADPVVVSNVSVGVMSVSATTRGSAWLSLSSASFTLSGQSSQPLAVSFDLRSLPSGLYYDTVFVTHPADVWNNASTDPAAWGPTRIPISVRLTDPPISTIPLTTFGMTPDQASHSVFVDSRIELGGEETLLARSKGALSLVSPSTGRVVALDTGGFAGEVGVASAHDAKFAPDGSIYWLRDSVTKSGNDLSSVWRMAASGGSSVRVGDGFFGKALAVTPDGAIYVLSTGHIYKRGVPPGSPFVSVADLPVASGLLTGFFFHPIDGGLYFIGASALLSRFDPSFSTVETRGAPLVGATGVVGIDAHGVIYVAGTQGRLIAVDPTGRVLSNRLLAVDAGYALGAASAVYATSGDQLIAYPLTPP